jgi:hypothetical protein
MSITKARCTALLTAHVFGLARETAVALALELKVSLIIQGNGYLFTRNAGGKLVENKGQRLKRYEKILGSVVTRSVARKGQA